MLTPPVVRWENATNCRSFSRAAPLRMTSRATPVAMREVRGLGWDIDTSYSSLRGELFPVGSYGHTGFTGTSLWIDPGSGGYVIILASRLYPDGAGDVTPLRARVATIAAAAMTDMSAAPRPTAPQLTSATVPARVSPTLTVVMNTARN